MPYEQMGPANQPLFSIMASPIVQASPSVYLYIPWSYVFPI